MPTTPSQAIIDSGTDPALNSIYTSSLQSVPVVTGANIYITTKQEFVNNYISENAAGGSEEQVQFNIGGRVVGDSGLTYDMETDSLTVVNIKSDNILYANGSPWVFSTYSNANVGQYLNTGTFNGNISANNFSANTYSGNAAGLRNITAANIVGSVPNAVYSESAGAVSSIAGANVIGAVANATYATSSGTAGSAATAQTVTQGAQANITSVGTLSSLTVSGTLQAGLFSGSGANLTNIPAGNILGTVASATAATTATSATTATTAGTVTTAAQPNITSVGTLTGLTVSGTGGLNAITANTLTVGSSTPFYAYANGVSNVTSTAASINTTSGALKVAGGLGVQGNIHAGMIESTGNLVGLLGLFGDNAQGTTFVNPVIIAKSTGTDYIQAAIINSTDSGSSDFTAYGDNGDEGTAWVDMGFTGSNFADANYTITGSNDGYLFAQGSGGLGGNLVLATGNLGYSIHRDIVFGTGGFLAENERMRLNHESLSLDISTQQPASNTTTGSFRVDGGVGITGNVHIGGKLYANTLNLSATGTTLDIGAGNMLLNKATGNSFAFMNGGFTVTMTAVGSATADYTLTLPTTAGTNGQVLTTNGSGDLSWSTVSGGSYGDSNVSTLLGSFGSNNIVTTGNIQAKNIRANASHANLVFGDATSSSGPGMSSTGTLAIVTNRGTSDKAWNFDTDGGLLVPGDIIPSANVTHDLGASSFGFGNLYVSNVITTGTISAGGKIGYSSGSTVTQTTNRGNGVNIDAISGTVVTVSASMVAGQIDTFTVINNLVDPNNDIIIAQVVSPYNLGSYNVVTGPSATGFYINLINISGFSISAEAVTIRFIVIKAPAA